MSRYVVLVVGPAGKETFLSRGREVGQEESATHYAHPSAAYAAAEAFLLKHPVGSVICDVRDTRDPERRV